MLTLPTDSSYGNVMPSFVRQCKEGVTVVINTINILNQKDKKLVLQMYPYFYTYI